MNKSQPNRLPQVGTPTQGESHLSGEGQKGLPVSKCSTDSGGSKVSTAGEELEAIFNRSGKMARTPPATKAVTEQEEQPNSKRKAAATQTPPENGEKEKVKKTRTDQARSTPNAGAITKRRVPVDTTDGVPRGGTPQAPDSGTQAGPMGPLTELIK